MGQVENMVDIVVNRLSWVDYIVFIAMLLVSSGIGIFFGCFGSRNKTSSDFLVAKRSMSTFPVVMSLIASFMSAIGLLGIPSDIYQNGTGYYITVINYVFVMPTVAYVYLPVFWNLQLTSANEYLEKRFNRVTRLLATFLFILQMSFYMAIAVYAPALALAQVTGLHVYGSVVSVCLVCIFYTTLGGMKAVMWTDVFQVIIMYGSMLIVIVKGTIDIGGFGNIYAAAQRGGRDNLFTFDMSITKKYTFWNVFIGGYFLWLSLYGVAQTQVQRYMTVSHKSQAVKALWLNIIGLFFMQSLSVYAGVLLYAKYENCDPISSHIVDKPDQMLPYFVMQTLSDYTGLAGLFVAGIFSGALSTISSGINSLAAIALEDIVKSIFPHMSVKTELITTKSLNFYFGVQTLALTFVAAQMGDVLSAALSLFGILGGPLIGLFTLGMFVPMANSIGAICSTVISTSLMLWIGMGFQVGMKTGTIKAHPLQLIPCSNLTFVSLSNSTLTAGNVYDAFTTAEPIVEDPMDYGVLNEIYKLSNMYYSVVGFTILMFTGCIISLLTGKNNKRKLDPKLLSPFVTWFKFLYPGYDTIGLDYMGEDLELHDAKHQ